MEWTILSSSWQGIPRSPVQTLPWALAVLLDFNPMIMTFIEQTRVIDMTKEQAGYVYITCFPDQLYFSVICPLCTILNADWIGKWDCSNTAIKTAVINISPAVKKINHCNLILWSDLRKISYLFTSHADDQLSS